MKIRFVLLFFIIALVLSTIAFVPVKGTPDKDQDCSKCHEEAKLINRRDKGKHKDWDKHGMDKSQPPKGNETDQEPEPSPIPLPETTSRSQERNIVWEILGIKITIPLEIVFGLTILFSAMITGLTSLAIWKIGPLPQKRGKRIEETKSH